MFLRRFSAHSRLKIPIHTNPCKADAKYVACDSGALNRNCKHRVQKNIKLQVYYTIINKESQQKSYKSGYIFEKSGFQFYTLVEDDIFLKNKLKKLFVPRETSITRRSLAPNPLFHVEQYHKSREFTPFVRDTVTAKRKFVLRVQKSPREDSGLLCFT